MSRYLLTGVLVALLALGASACGSGDDEEAEPAGGGSESAAQTIEISGTEFALEPATVQLDEAGTYTFRFTNDGGAVHALEIEGSELEEETEEIQPGESADLTVELADGEYELYCPVGNHADEGMEGTVVVGAGGGTTTDDDGTTTDDDGTTTDDDGTTTDDDETTTEDDETTTEDDDSGSDDDDSGGGSY